MLQAATTPERELARLLATLEPVLQPGVWAYVTAPPGAHIDAVDPLATFREQEGLTLIIPAEQAARAGWPVLCRCAWITLTVYSDLTAVGLTAAFAEALAAAGISCNVMAAAHHDHIFVPETAAAQAIEALQALQARSQERGAWLSGDG